MDEFLNAFGADERLGHVVAENHDGLFSGTPGGRMMSTQKHMGWPAARRVASGVLALALWVAVCTAYPNQSEAASDYEPPVTPPTERQVVELAPPSLLAPRNRAAVRATWQYDWESEDYVAEAAVQFRVRSIPGAASDFADEVLYMEMSQQPYLDPVDGLFSDPFIISFYGDDLYWDFIEVRRGVYRSGSVNLEPGVYYWHSVIASDCDYAIIGDNCQYKISGVRKLIVKPARGQNPYNDIYYGTW